MSFQQELQGQLGQHQRYTNGALMARVAGLDTHTLGMAKIEAARTGKFMSPQPAGKKSFKDELQSDIDDWLKDVKI